MKITVTDLDVFRSECPHFFEGDSLNMKKLSNYIEAILEIGLRPNIKGIKVEK